MISQILFALLLGSTIGTILARFFASPATSLFFASQIPGLTPDLATQKSFDLLEFVFTITISTLIFFVNYLVTNKSTTSKIFNWSFTLISLALYIQTQFVTSSGKQVLFLSLILQLLYLLSSRLLKQSPILLVPSFTILANGLLVGFYFLQLANHLSTSLAVSLLAMLIPPILYLALPISYKKFLTHPLHLLIIVTIINPSSLPYLIGIGIITLISILASSFFNFLISSPHRHLKYLYAFTFILILNYNPLYYAGNFDSIEEGFWLGWLQGLSTGKHLYKDIAAFHPPILPWLLLFFTKLAGYSVQNVRLFFHLLQLVAFCIYFVFVHQLLERKLHQVIVMLILFSLAPVLVRNNVEIRTSVGLLACIPLYHFFQHKIRTYLFISGCLSSLAIFTSLEVGLAIFLSITFTLILTQPSRLKPAGVYLAGVLIASLPIILYLFFTNSLLPFIQQMTFYIQSFSQGYFNIPVDRPILVSFLRWHLIWQNFTSPAWLYEGAKFILLATGMFLFSKLAELQIFSKKNFLNFTSLAPKHRLMLVISLFSLLLFRSVVGRFDYYHVLFVVFITIPLLFSLLEQLKINPLANALIISFLIFVVFSNQINESYLSRLAFRLTTYGEIVEDYKRYSLDRSHILVGTEIPVQELEHLIPYIQQHTTESQTIFVYPWNPEVYFLSNRNNATSFDIPYAFWDQKYQQQMINQLQANPPALIILNSGMQFGGLTPDSLPLVSQHLSQHYQEATQLHSFTVLVPRKL